MSLSARRAWIEIESSANYLIIAAVALRKESVDRNTKNPMIRVDKVTSLSARRAWIEIRNGFAMRWNTCVALRKESVDRNHTVQVIIVVVDSRSPQGERG